MGKKRMISAAPHTPTLGAILAFDHFDIVYMVSTDPTGGWKKPVNHELLTEWSCASEHPTFDGITYMLYIVQEEINGIGCIGAQ